MKRHILILLSLLFYHSSFAYTFISQFRSAALVQEDASLVVTEKIEISSDGKILRHGIFRDLPFRYKTPYGFLKEVQFRVLKTTLNNSSIPYTEEKLDDTIRIKIGDPKMTLPAGNYTFMLSYYISDMVGFFKDHDELFWNTTGNSWNFPIGNATQTVILPNNAIIDKVTAFTGIAGSTLQNYTSHKSGSEITFTTTKTINIGEGMTIVLSWQKGIIIQKSFSQKLISILKSRSIIISLTALGLLLLYYLILLILVNEKKPSKGVIFPQFKPPEGFSPAELDSILEMSFKMRDFISTIVHLATKGFLIIEQVDHLNFNLIKVQTENNLTGPEKNLYEKLFSTSDTVSMNSTQLADALIEFAKSMSKAFLNTYFVTNWNFCAAATIFSGIFLWATYTSIPFLIFTSTVWFLILFFPNFRSFKEFSSDPFFSPIFQKAAFYIISLISAGTLTLLHPDLIDLVYMAITSGFVSINLFFPRLLRYYTQKGQVIADHSEGFKMFLNATEKQRLEMLSAPDLTLDLYERYLPYAIAFGIEKKWSDQFMNKFNIESNHPTWYHGTRLLCTFGNLSKNLSTALGSAISTQAPGGKSGFGRGAGSGRGGGGGGGSGW